MHQQELPGEDAAEVDLSRGASEEGRLREVLGEGRVVEPDVGLDDLMRGCGFFFLKVEKVEKG